jgi:hypothetical protein
VSTSSSEPVPYRVVYSERVRQRLLALADVARTRGDGAAFVAALKEFHRRLCVYPQFGEPLVEKAVLTPRAERWCADAQRDT